MCDYSCSYELINYTSITFLLKRKWDIFLLHTYCTRKLVYVMIIDLVYSATRMPDTRDASATRVQHKWHERVTSDTNATRVRHERRDCDTSEKFCFDNDTIENIFSDPYISYMANERLQFFIYLFIRIL